MQYPNNANLFIYCLGHALNFSLLSQQKVMENEKIASAPILDILPPFNYP